MVSCLDPSSCGMGRSISSAPHLFTPSVRAGIGIDADDFRLSPSASSDRFTFHVLRADASLIQGYWSLRPQHQFRAPLIHALGARWHRN